MGYHVSSILSVSPNDIHAYFAYYVPARRFEYEWINKWIENNFLKLAESFGPQGVIITPSPNRRDEYIESFQKVERRGDMILHSGLPFIIFSRTPLQNEAEENSAIIINLAGCKDDQVLGRVIDTFVETISEDDWSKLESLPELRDDSESKHKIKGLLDFIDSVELKPNMFGVGVNFNQILRQAALSAVRRRKK